MTFKELLEEIDVALLDREPHIREGQFVFNYIDKHYGVARDVIEYDGVDCYYKDSEIIKFINCAYRRIENNEMDKVNVIHTGKGLIPQETFGQKFEYIPCLLEQPYIELMDFNEFKKIWCRGRKEHKTALK